VPPTKGKIMKIIEVDFKEVPLHIITRRYSAMTVEQAVAAFTKRTGIEPDVVYKLPGNQIAIPFVAQVLVPDGETRKWTGVQIGMVGNE
jgi:isocitrate dehydrogenase